MYFIENINLSNEFLSHKQNNVIKVDNQVLNNLR